MSHTTVILCEGAQDQAVLSALVEVTCKWQSVRSRFDGPSDLLGYYPEYKKNKYEEVEYQPLPTCFRKQDKYLLIRSLGGIERVLGAPATSLLSIFCPDAFGVMLDANGVGVEARLKEFREIFKSEYQLVETLEPGEIIDGPPRIGLWIAPDNKKDGTVDDLIIQWLQKPERKKLVASGKRFIESLKKQKLENLTGHESKAILGAIHQCVNPGASLAVSLKESKCWLEPDVKKCKPLYALQQFIENLTS